MAAWPAPDWAKRVTPADELRLAIEIVEHTLDQLYELPEKAEELKRAKALRQKKQSKAHP
jgi:hypothetical protein